MKHIMDALENLVWVSQLGLSMLLPLVAGLWLCSWLVGSCGAPAWLYLVFIGVGLAAGAGTFFRFGRMLEKRAQQKKDQNGRPPPVSFNRHD